MTKVRVGLVGTGVIAQVMHLHHLHHLAELADRRHLGAGGRSAERFARAAAEQRHNREFLAVRGL